MKCNKYMVPFLTTGIDIIISQPKLDILSLPPEGVVISPFPSYTAICFEVWKVNSPVIFV